MLSRKKSVANPEPNNKSLKSLQYMKPEKKSPKLLKMARQTTPLSVDSYAERLV